MTLITGLTLPTARLPDQGRVRIRPHPVLLIDRPAPAPSAPSALALGRRLLRVLLQLGQSDAHDRVERSVGPHQTRIGVELASFDQPCLQALLHALAKEPGKDFWPPAPPRLGQDAVIGNLVFQAVAEEPQIVDPQRNDPHQLPLAAHIIPEEQEHHLHHQHRIDRDVALAPVRGGDFFAHELQLDRLPELAQRMIRRNPLRQVHRLTP